MSVLEHNGVGTRCTNATGSDTTITNLVTDMAQASGYHPPEGFNFSKPEGWPSWIRRFRNYRIASKLDLEDEKRQISSLLWGRKRMIL